MEHLSVFQYRLLLAEVVQSFTLQTGIQFRAKTACAKYDFTFIFLLSEMNKASKLLTFYNI